MKKIILHLCADVGSDSRYYQLDNDYNVVLIGEKIGVENYNPPKNVYGIIANPPCTEFSTVKNHKLERNLNDALYLVDKCMEIINKCNPEFWVVENPATGLLKNYLGKPKYIYQPWQYGDPWTKKTALWGKFNIPEHLYKKWENVPKNNELYIRPRRKKPSLAFLHKSSLNFVPKWSWAKDRIKSDSDLRSMCADGFAREFYLNNK